MSEGARSQPTARLLILKGALTELLGCLGALAIRLERDAHGAFRHDPPTLLVLKHLVEGAAGGTSSRLIKMGRGAHMSPGGRPPR